MSGACRKGGKRKGRGEKGEKEKREGKREKRRDRGKGEKEKREKRRERGKGEKEGSLVFVRQGVHGALSMMIVGGRSAACPDEFTILIRGC